VACAGSGNVGITASLPFVPICEEHGKSEEEMLRAICLSFLMTIYIKSHIGRLSAMCACAIAAGVGVTAGTALLLGNSYEEVEMAIDNVVGSLGGVLCDGAKLGCAMKLSTAVGVAIESAYLAVAGISIPKRDGLVSDTADETLKLLGKIAKEGMIDTDIVMCRAIIEREQQAKRN
ncbi:MAG: serine dehydratase subunit alpha family protein, partial [Clostridiales bacterium]|nr:serine dehydratase subunit alpha family protein [Clostridiales bacterium]